MAPVSWYRRPLPLGLVGVLLMVAGYRLTLLGPAPRQTEQARKLDELRKMADGDEALTARLDAIGRQTRWGPAYPLIGRLVLLLGLGLFVLAGVQMTRAAPPPKKDEEDEARAAGALLGDEEADEAVADEAVADEGPVQGQPR